MIVCLCKAVSDRRIREAIGDGASSVDAIGRACEAGTDCGTCRPDLERMLQPEPRLRIVEPMLVARSATA